MKVLNPESNRFINPTGTTAKKLMERGVVLLRPDRKTGGFVPYVPKPFKSPAFGKNPTCGLGMMANPAPFR